MLRMMVMAVQWLPSALEESGALPGILMCCYALAQSPDRCAFCCLT